ncbi:MAG: hypothetical protein M0Q51_03535 [Bacteroidales bacterium]|nr:hypothetical protein [Bacteroidales bacterium]
MKRLFILPSRWDLATIGRLSNPRTIVRGYFQLSLAGHRQIAKSLYRYIATLLYRYIAKSLYRPIFCASCQGGMKIAPDEIRGKKEVIHIKSPEGTNEKAVYSAVPDGTWQQ